MSIHQTRIGRWLHRIVLAFFVLDTIRLAAQPTNALPENPGRSVLLEAAGEVECLTAAKTNWHSATIGTALFPGDRVRTHELSRAAVQLSDRSVIRLNERTTLELLPPRHAEKKRFGVPAGSVFFFDREKPADVEFDTPLAAGAIRGTEFLLAVAENTSAVRLALIDGLVSLDTTDSKISIERGQDVQLTPGQPIQKTALVNVTGPIQWALYYPAVLNPDDLAFTPAENTELATVLSSYRAGDLLSALAQWPSPFSGESSGAQMLRAALFLSVGQVADAEATMAQLPTDAPGAKALRELIATVKNEKLPSQTPRAASEFLARTYTLQAAANLPEALAAAQAAVRLAPKFGFARARLAELYFAFGDHRAALKELNQALLLSPRLAPAHALRGFVLLNEDNVSEALKAFDQARQLDAAFGPAWLGRGLCLLHERDFDAARSAFQAAAALEPQRAVFRSYLGKAASELGDAKAAEKEFTLAKRLDPNDPTGWLYSALHLWEENRINESIRDLEHAEAVNDSRAPFRSRLLLDQDQSVASADVAALYDDAGLSDVSRHTAVRAVNEDYANFSGHLFLANSLQSLEAANRFDLRFETARESELLVANLLAPPGAGNLSQQLSQQEHLRFFDPRPIGASSLTEYDSRGNWSESGTAFGTVDGFSYAFDARYESFNGQRINNAFDSRRFALTLKQRITPDDELYFQAGHFQSQAGDLANYYNPAQANPSLNVNEKQEPTIFAGWHHTWSPGSHTLLLVSRLTDTLHLHDPNGNVPFLFFSGGAPQSFGLLPFAITNDLSDDFTLYSTELQQIWETPHQSLVIGGRWQTGDVNAHSTLVSELTGQVTDQHQNSSLQRGDVYGYYSWRVTDALQLIGGASYDHVRYPENPDISPISAHEQSRDLSSPKAGLLFAPWKGGLFRASYTKSLGGLFFDNSVRLEPTEVGGFNQAFRSLIPESVAGLVPGTKFQTAGAGFDQSFASGTFFGVEGEWLTSDGSRTIGALTNSSFLNLADSPSGTRQNLNFRERDLSGYAGQLLGNYLALGARYRLSDAHLVGQFPLLPEGLDGLQNFTQNNHATLQQLSLTANMNLPCGLFAQWQSDWYHQNNSGYAPALADSDFWQHNFFAGYRFPRRYAEIRLGVLNIFDRDYRLNPLNLYSDLPRGRTFTASLQINF